MDLSVNKFTKEGLAMNKYMVKANELWRENRIERAINNYERALHCPHSQSLEKQIAHYMIAYLNCVLARRLSQEETFLGVDLRCPYEDHYLKAGQHLSMLDQEHDFDPDALGLPKIDIKQRAYIDEAYGYYSQVCDDYLQSWHMRLKAYLNNYMTGVWHHVQNFTRA